MDTEKAAQWWNRLGYRYRALFYELGPPESFDRLSEKEQRNVVEYWKTHLKKDGK